MSTPTGPPSRGRLALALTAAAAAAAPASAPAAPVARAGLQSPTSTTAAGRAPHALPAPRGLARADSAAASPRLGPVIVEYAIRPAALDVPPRASAASGRSDATPSEDVLGAVAPPDIELLKLTRAGTGSRLAVAVDEPGLLRLTWTADGVRGTARQALRPGRQELRLTTPRRATHVRVHATYEPASGGQSAATHGAFRLRAS